MLRLVSKRGIGAGFLSCLNFDLHFTFETGCVRNVVRMRITIVGSDCRPGLVMYSVCMVAGEKRESIIVVYHTLMICITLPRNNFFQEKWVPVSWPVKEKLLFTECDYFRIRTWSGSANYAGDEANICGSRILFTVSRFFVSDTISLSPVRTEFWFLDWLDSAFYLARVDPTWNLQGMAGRIPESGLCPDPRMF